MLLYHHFYHLLQVTNILDEIYFYEFVNSRSVFAGIMLCNNSMECVVFSLKIHAGTISQELIFQDLCKKICKVVKRNCWKYFLSSSLLCCYWSSKKIHFFSGKYPYEAIKKIKLIIYLESYSFWIYLILCTLKCKMTATEETESLLMKVSIILLCLNRI